MKEQEVTEKDLLHKAIDLLSRREYAQAELETKLKRIGSEEQVESVLQRLQEDGYQSDLRFVESFIRMRVGQGHGLIRIRFDLSKKGIEGDLLREVLDELEVDWYEQARELYQRKYSKPLDKQDYKEKSKRMRYMAQRGYSMDEIKYAIDHPEGELG
ncbi:regulatory protein RecX [Neptuniibacter caesariensis]|uniref:Regulatory protein RecX n=1 Tax=Neptuniibacter caesariensis TaxID=207954 RepID=A0A7U8GUD4_NEPCE|nr:regulatory protein RecX [Neptuniibacter caesariensis]EAR63070.1 RecA regulator RecX [Oceanospirillum sp. MED92] [Neptuniibacter caesariensis]